MIDLNTYDYVEGTEFDGLMPAVMEKNPTIGVPEDNKNVRFFDNFHLGSDNLEVLDVQGFYADGGEESGPTGETGSTGETGPTGE